LNDVAVNYLTNGFFARLAQKPAGRKALQEYGESLVDRYARSGVGVMQEQGNYNLGATWMHNHADKILPEWRSTHNPFIRFYGTLLEAIHNGPKTSFYMQNAFLHKWKTGKNMSKRDLARLVNETRQLSGDMSKSGMARQYNKIAGALPYANVYVQSMAHIARAFQRHRMLMTLGFFNSVVVPAVVMRSLIDKAGSDTQNWYYNLLPNWSRGSGIVLPLGRLEATEEILSSTYQHKDEDWITIPLAPEFVPFLQMSLAGIEFLGGSSASKSRAVQQGAFFDLHAAFETLAPQLVPPLVNAVSEGIFSKHLDPAAALAKPFNAVGIGQGGDIARDKVKLKLGADPEAIRVNSNIGRDSADALFALFGTSARVFVEMGLAAEQADRLDDGAIEGFQRVFREGFEM